jgi:putative restriction endonuclease
MHVRVMTHPGWLAFIGCDHGLGRADHEAAPVNTRRRTRLSQSAAAVSLGHFPRNGDTPILYSEAEERLSRLLQEFGPPRPTSPAYPFHHLTTDGLWVVTTAAGADSPGASRTALRGQRAAGRLVPDLARSLGREPQLLPQLAHVILDTNFEPCLHEDIRAAVGLDPEDAETEPAQEDKRRRRDPDFACRVLLAYEYRCSFYGYDGFLDGFTPGLEAAHVRWWTHGGPNNIANGLCLCSIHHKLFDKGVLSITGQHQITVSAHFVGRSQTAELLVLSLTGRQASQPLKGFPAVAAAYAAWHAREVFRGPARAA